MLGIDYAWKPHPTPQQTKAAGFGFMCRYVSTDAKKNITREEAEDLKAAGIARLCELDGTRVVASAGADAASRVGASVVLAYSRVDADGALREARIIDVQPE